MVQARSISDFEKNSGWIKTVPLVSPKSYFGLMFQLPQIVVLVFSVYNAGVRRW